MKFLRSIVCFMLFSMCVPLIAQSQNPTPDEKELIKRGLLKLETAQEAAALKNRPNTASSSPLPSLLAPVKGTFWRNADWVKLLDITTEQQRKMDDIFQQYRLKLIDLRAALEKEELILEPLLGNTRPAPEAEPKILTQIDRIADARAELEKATSRMLVSILQVLNAEQWTKLPIQKKEPSIFSKPGR